MKRWSRRRFLAASAATVCVGCTSGDDAVTAVSSRTGPAGGPLDERPAASLPAVVPTIGAATVVGPIEDVRRQAQQSPIYVAEARAWVVHVADDEIDATVAASDERLHPGHPSRGDGALPEVSASRLPGAVLRELGWFECPCHASKYTRLGEHREGPGPRGLDAVPIRGRRRGRVDRLRRDRVGSSVGHGDRRSTDHGPVLRRVVGPLKHLLRGGPRTV